MPCLEEIAIIVAADLPIGLRRNDCGFAGGGEQLDRPFIGIERLVGDPCAGASRAAGDRLRQEQVLMNAHADRERSVRRQSPRRRGWIRGIALPAPADVTVVRV